MKNETIERLEALWKPLEQERSNIRFPNWWERKKPKRRELARLSIRTWNNHPDWYRLIGIYWMIGGWMHFLLSTDNFPYDDNTMRDDAQIAAWKLGEYIELIHDKDLRSFIERLQQIAYLIIDSIDSE